MRFTEKYTGFLIKHSKLILIVFAVLVIFSLLLTTMVSVNYDLAEYLPADSGTKKAITVLKEEFGYPGMVRVMAENVSLTEAMLLKDKIAAVEGVASVMWLDSVQDMTVPEDAMKPSVRDAYYKDNTAIYTVQFVKNDYDPLTGKAIELLRDAVGDDVIVSGSAEDSRNMREVLGSEVLVISLVVVPVCILFLIFASRTWIEPLIYIATMMVSVVINMGTNVFFNGVSFITFAMASVLQLAISMDYSLFLLHRYLEERDDGKDVPTAISNAIRKSIVSVSASALTTIAGFMALLFMQYGLGADMGLVLAKGIVFSFINVLVILPVLIYVFRNVLEKTAHRQFIPSFRKLGRGVVKIRFAILALIVLTAAPLFMAQSNNSFLYGDSSASANEGIIGVNKQKIRDRFGPYNPVMLIVPTGDPAKEHELALALEKQEHIGSVQSITTIADPALPRELIPRSALENFVSDKHARLIVLLNVEGETPDTYRAVEELSSTAEQYYPGEWLTAGTSSSVADIKQSIESDSLMVSLFSIIAVGLIVLLTARSALLPILLVAVIQISIWLNMSFPYFAGETMIYIGYLIISSLQLGATIDYAILLSNRYLEFRRTCSPKDSAVNAIQTAGISIVVSSLILTTAGFAEGLLSQISSISAMGILLGRGALLSGAMVLLCLPALLVIFDKVIIKTTMGMKDVYKGADSVRLTEKVGAPHRGK